MYIFDTDHLTVLQRGGIGATQLRKNLRERKIDRITTSIISCEEQFQGWLNFIKRQESPERQALGYVELKRQLENYCTMNIMNFDRQASEEFQRLRKQYRRIGTMDLKIASIAVMNKATVLTRNISDFGRISVLQIENWT
ncbi:MAG: type II toxin-antitoxin system VapC family toxin [Phormidesmis sp.]